MRVLSCGSLLLKGNQIVPFFQHLLTTNCYNSPVLTYRLSKQLYVLVFALRTILQFTKKNVYYFYCRANSPPTFTVIPSDVKINDGQTIVLKAIVDGNYYGINVIRSNFIIKIAVLLKLSFFEQVILNLPSSG